MFSIPSETILYHITPMMTGLFLLLSLAYLIVIRQYKSTEFPFYVCFLLCFVIFLFGRPLQFYSGHILAHLILYVRFFILFAIGFPSLLIANKIRCGMTLNRFNYAVPYALGSLGSIIFVMVRDGCTYQILFSEKYGSMLPLMFTEATYSDMLIIITSILVVLPSVYLIYFHIRHNPQAHSLMILISSLLLGGLYITGEILNLYWLFYIGSLLIAACWLCVGYEDIQSLKVQAADLQDELSNILLVNPKSMSHTEQRALKSQSLQFSAQLDEVTEQAYHSSTDDINGLIKADPNKPTVKNRELVDKAMSYIKANFNKDIELAGIAHYTEVSDSYLIRTFKKVTGKTINQYITCFRVQRAQQLLKNHSVMETSIAVGFKNPSYFSTVFKKQTGLSPLHYQQQRS